MGKKRDLSDFERGMVVGRDVQNEASEAVRLLQQTALMLRSFDTVLYCAIWWSIQITTPTVIQMICSLGCHCKVHLYINNKHICH